MNTSPLGKVQKKDLWNNSVKEQAFSGDTLPGKLGWALQRTEYTMLGEAPIFEGSFVQVTKKGEYIGIHNHPNIVTVGILATKPTLLLPNLMIIAQEKRGTGARGSKAKDLEITRFVPLELVEIFLDNLNERRLKVRMKTGQKYYLQLHAPGRDESFLFDQWLRLIYLMHRVRGRIRKPASSTSKESGHPVLQKSSSTLGLTKKHWLPAIMDQGSTGRLKEQLRQVHSSKETQSTIESDIASKHSLLKSDLAAFSSVSPFGISGSVRHASKGQPLYTDPKVAQRSQAKKLVAPQAGSPSFGRPELRKKSIPKQNSPCSVGVRSLEFAPRSQDMGLSHPGGPSMVTQQMKAVESCPTKSVRKHSATKPEDILPAPMTSSKAKYIPVKLQRSKKSEALARSHKTRREKATVKSHETCPVPQKSPKPPTEGRQGAASQTSSVKSIKPPSRPMSERMPSSNPTQLCNISTAVGPSKTHTVSVAVGPSVAATAPTTVAPSRPTSQGTRVASETRRTVAAPSKRPSGDWSMHASPSSTANRKPGKPSKSTSSRPKVSSTPSPKQGRSSSSTPTQKKENLVALHRTEESVAVGPSTVDNVFRSRPPSRALGPDKQSGSQDKRHGQNVKNKGSSRPSSATGRHKPSRSRESESKNKLKAVLSAAKQKSSVTFLTIYSVLSSSFDRAKHSMSRDNNAKTLSRNPSKRVTIWDEAGPSGKSVLEPEEVGDYAKDKPPVSSRPEPDTQAAATNVPAGQGAASKKAASSTKPLSQIAAGEP